MTSLELKEIVEERLSDPIVLGRLACNLHRSDVVHQRHHDDRSFSLDWHDYGDFWRCTITSADGAKHVAQVDIHQNATVRVDSFEPCRVTISPEEGFLCLTRYKQP